MKFKEETCENCGLDLTTVETEDVREMPLKGEMVFVGECPQCNTNRIMVAPEPEPPSAPPKTKGRRGASEPEVTEPESGKSEVTGPED